MESPPAGNTMPQSHQELFGYYMNEVLERKDNDNGSEGVFVATSDDLSHKRPESGIAGDVIKNINDSSSLIKSQVNGRLG